MINYYQRGLFNIVYQKKINMKTIVVPYNYDDDLQDLMEKKECMAVGIEEMSITYTQLPDTNSSSDEYQHLTVTTKTACSTSKEETDKREGYYFDITIPEGKHWSIENGNEIKTIIEDFKNRLYKTTKEK